jgi:hypothetical protein
MDKQSLANHRPLLHAWLFLSGATAMLLLLVIDSNQSSGYMMGNATLVIRILAAVNLAAGVWMLGGRPWRKDPRPLRLNLAFAYLGLGWLNSVLMFFAGRLPSTADPIVYCVGPLFLIAFFLARVLPHLRWKEKGEDLFP